MNTNSQWRQRVNNIGDISVSSPTVFDASSRLKSVVPICNLTT